jgi:hypothetical protein
VTAFKCSAAYALVTILLTATAFPQTADTTPTQGDGADSDAIYSVVIPKELRSWPLKRYVIAQETVTEGWQIPAIAGRPGKGVRECVAVPTAEAWEYETAIADFERKNSSSEAVGARLRLDKSYLLLNADEVVNFKGKLMAAFGIAPENYQPDRRFDGDTALISVSRVGFSGEGNVAIVYVEHHCG